MRSGSFAVATSKRMEMIDITGQLQHEITKSKTEEGVLFVFNPHTTAAITINEGADPAVQNDIIAALQKVVPMNFAYTHLEGNSPAHLMSSLVGTSENVFVESGKIKLGTWQKIFFCEFDGPRARKVLWRIL